MTEPEIQQGRECCLFLDIDGTLLDIAPTPHDVHVDESLRALLRRVERACDGALALVSGRTISDIDELFDPLYLPVAGVHGCERRDGHGYWRRECDRSPAFVAFCETLRAAVGSIEGVLLEDKDCGVALHYRLRPQMQDALRRTLERLAPAIPATHVLLEGDEVIEVKPSACDKGSAVESFLSETPFAGRFPIFIGDDVTDRDGFDAVRRRGGLAVAVGRNVHSEWQLADPGAVRRWLAAFIATRTAE